MLKAIMTFGSIFAAGYVARKYFGWNPKGLMDQAKGKLNDLTDSSSSAAAPLKASLKDTAERHAI
jgi:hypothetical protein